MNFIRRERVEEATDKGTGDIEREIHTEGDTRRRE